MGRWSNGASSCLGQFFTDAPVVGTVDSNRCYLAIGDDCHPVVDWRVAEISQCSIGTLTGKRVLAGGTADADYAVALSIE